MYLTHFIYIVASLAAILKCNAEEDILSILSLSGSTAATHHLRRSDLFSGQEEESMKQKAQRTLSVAGTRLFQTVSRVLEEECCCCCCDNNNNAGDDTDVGDNDNNVGDTGADDTDGNSPPSGPNSSPTPVPTTSVSLSPSYMYKKIYASDGNSGSIISEACATKDDSIVLAAPKDSGDVGAVYLFNRDGTNEVKLTPGVDAVGIDRFGNTVSMDEKIVVGTGVFSGNYIRVYSREGIYENTITCTDCSLFGNFVATHGNKIVANAKMNDNTHKVFIYDTDGVKQKELVVPIAVVKVAISEQFIVAVASESKVYIYSNSAPDFSLVTEIDVSSIGPVAVSGNRVVIGHWANSNVWLYSTDGSLIKKLDHDVFFAFGSDVDITDDKVYVGSSLTDSIWIYSADTGDFIEEITSPDGEEGIYFGYSVCVSESFYVVGAISARNADDVVTGAAYSINLPL